MMRASHWTQHKFLAIYINRGIHRILVVRVVARRLVETDVSDIRSNNVVIATALLFLNDKPLE